MAEIDPIALERATERLRQERETFNQLKLQDDRWFRLRLVMGYTSVVLLAAIMAVSTFILFNNRQFPEKVLIAAGAALFTDVLGLLVGVWRIALNPGFLTKLSPLTRDTASELNHAGSESSRRRRATPKETA